MYHLNKSAKPQAIGFKDKGNSAKIEIKICKIEIWIKMM